MDESPAPRPRPRPAPPAAPAAPPALPVAPPTSRRWFLAGGAAVLVGAGAGVAAEFVHDRPPRPRPRAPRMLVAAAAAEQALIADLDATTGGAPPVRAVIAQARANHAAHLAALRDLLSGYRAEAAPSTSRPAGTARTLAQLRAAEQRAARGAGARAARLTGAQAALMASIAACESTHAALLT
jgi:hypothetical protein